MPILIGAIVVAAIAFFVWRVCWHKVVVFEFEKGLLIGGGSLRNSSTRAHTGCPSSIRR
jgi:hypothetical protein